MANQKSDAINTHEDKKFPQGMLSSPHIAYCVEKYKIITGYDSSCLGPATYHMRIGRSVLTWENGKKIEFTLGDKEDKDKGIRKSVDLKPNSLTFITTFEDFNLPKDIIARFNLKSKLVHQGLLLGTGPIVDPELQANLLIPLHNFSSQTVTLNYKDKIISVEFTKTLDPDDINISKNGKFPYINNEHWDFNFEKYREKIGRKQVESSVSSAFDNYDQLIDKYQNTLDDIKEENKKALKRFNLIGGLTAGATIIGLIALVITTWSLLSSSFDKVNESTKIIMQFNKENRIISKKIDSYDYLKKQFIAMKLENEDIRKKLQLKPQQVSVCPGRANQLI